MMSCYAVSGATARSYFDHSSDYYTENHTNFDKWHGSLAETLGAKGELSKEQFDALLSQIEAAGRTRTGVDCSFSAPKSVSLAMAADEQTRLDMIAAHQAAVDKLARKIEMQYIGVKTKNGIPPLSRNMVAAEFVHTTARPTEANNFVPDLDLHSHLYIHNMTYYDGKLRAVDFKKLMDNQKELGLEYRRELAAELQAKGYELELTDPTRGFFELKGFDREIIEQYSHREAEIQRYAEANDATPSEAKILSRTAKDKATKNFNEICKDVRKDLFQGKVKIGKREENDNAKEGTRREETVRAQYEEQARIERDRDARRNAAERTRSTDSISSAGQSDAPTFGADTRSGSGAFAERLSLSKLPTFDMDAESLGDRVLVSDRQLHNLAELQTARVRDHFLLRAAEIRRTDEIDEIAKRAIDRLAAEKYAFSVHEAQQRIMAEGLLQNVRQEEAEAALERAKVVKLGRIEKEVEREQREYTKEEIDRYNYVKAIKTKNGTWIPEKNSTKAGGDVYLTTEKNLEREARIKERVIEGKEKITAGAMTQEEARDALHRIEEAAIENGTTDFRIQGGEQAAAVEHILCCQDQYVCVDGLAGTGKTTMMERLNWICQEQGIEIKGCCFTGKAADGLQADSGIDSTTIHSFLNKLERESGIKPPEGQSGEIRQSWDFSRVRHLEPGQREIWAVDEAGLVDNNLMYELQTAAEARGAQLLLLGDPDQLPPVGLGEPMRDMEESGMATAHLTDIRRQKDGELLRAVQESVRGDHLITFEVLEQKGAYREIKDAAERRETVKVEMTREPLSDYKERLLLVGRNVDRKAYNKAIRAEYVQKGELEQGRKFTIENTDGGKETRYFASKDRIIFLQNDKQIGVMNGTMATVQKIDGNQITAKTDAGKLVTFNMEQYAKIDHSYAVTDYKAQGMTVKKVVADMSVKASASNRNKLYVDISRAKHEAIVFTDDKEKLEKQTRNFAKKITGKDFAAKIEQMRLQGGVRNNDRYHAPTRDWGAEMDRALKQVEQHTLGASKENILSRTPSSRTPSMRTGKSAGMDGPSVEGAIGKAVSIPVEVTGQMMQAAAAVASLIPVVGKAIAAPANAIGKGLEKAGQAVGKVVKVTVKMAKGAVNISKSAINQSISQGQKMAQRWQEADRAAQQLNRNIEQQKQAEMQKAAHEQEYVRTL